MIMFRSRDIVLVGLMLGLAAFTYKVKYEASLRYAQIRQIERQIEAEQDTINLLKAEWALVSAPTRMARLLKHYAGEVELETINPDQIVKWHEVPPPLPDAIDLLIAENIDESDFSVDLLLTGSVAP